MQFGICLLSLVPCRREPAGTSEMVTQLLFGEHYTVVEQKEDWLKIISGPDAYDCWISAKQHSPLSQRNFDLLSKEPQHYATDLIQIVTDVKRNIRFPITLGCTLPFLTNSRMLIEDREFLYEGSCVLPAKKGTAADLLQTAYQLLNAPYLWGGRGPFGIDCSGFTQLIYKLNGYLLPRDACQQVTLGEPLSFVEEAQAGDLAFFDNEEGKIIHVGIVLDQLQILHASGSVRIDKYDHYGIFNGDSGRYSHSMRVIKRLLPENH
jgi:gamma-D-glutamyl-L-lysine dipeptidyl-peptidase